MIIVDIEPEEVWEYIKPKKADHIRVCRGLYNHHGIFVSEDEVIHFASEGDDNLLGTTNEVISTDLDEFLRDIRLEVKIYSEDELVELYPVQAIVDYARACIGDAEYNLVINNCEHFANRCTLGSHRSNQVEKVLTGGLSPIKKGFDMIGFVKAGVSALTGMAGGLFGGGKDSEKRITTTTYEPDKVRVAEINAQTQAMVEKVRFEDNRLKEKAQKELVSHMIEQEKILMQAKIEGFEYLSESIKKLGNNIALLRIEQKQSLDTNQDESVQKINKYYVEFEKTLEDKNSDFELNHLPKLVKQLETYKEGSVGYKTYESLIGKRMVSHCENIDKEIDFFRKQNEKRTDSNIKIREQLESDLSSMSNKILETVNKQSKLLGINKNEKALLEDSKQKMIEEEKIDEKVEEKPEPKPVNDINNQEEDFIDV